MRKLLTKLGKPADLNLATIVKIISDWASFLKKISPFASTLFILLNLGTLLKKKASVITLLILVPLLIITRKPEVLRVIFSIALFWIFLEKFSSGIGKMDRRLAVFLCLYALVIFGCIFDPWLYLMMYDGSFRYRFILESHNALCILVFMIFIYLLETLLDTIPRPGRPWHRPLLVVSICALILVFLFIKSRLYIGMTFAFLCIVAFKRWRQMRILLLLPIVYAGVEPLPGEFSELEPAMVGEPAQFMPAQRVRGRLLEPDEPLQAGVLMEGRLIEPTEPLRPVYKSVHPGIPAEPAHFESVQPGVAAEPAHFESVQPGVPAEPLLPAHFRSVDPGIPAEPLEPLAEA